MTIETHAICTSCEKSYNIKNKQAIITKLPYTLSFNHDELCLACIINACHNLKNLKKPRIKGFKQAMEYHHKLYEIAGSSWQALVKEYNDLDYIENMITYKTAKPKPAEKDTSVKKGKKSKKKKSPVSQAMKVLNALSPEQQAKIIASIEKQAKIEISTESND